MYNPHMLLDPDVAQMRMSLYSFLAELYNREVDGDVLARLRALPFEGDGADSPVVEQMRILRDEARGAADDEAYLSTLAVDFANLFLGANKRTDGAYPYESVYTSSEGLLNQDSTEAVLHAYRVEGFGQGMHYRVPDDHISLEFSFMVRLISKAQEALSEGDEEGAAAYAEKQRAFFVEHIQPWVCRFTEKGCDFARTPFYMSVFKLTDAFMAEETALLGA